MIKLLSLLFLFLPSNAFAVRAIMEGLPATSNTIIVDTANVRVGIGVASPSTALQVSGVVTATSYAGSGASLTGIPTVAQLTSTASALTSETARAIARENEIGVSTGVIQASLNQVIASTEALKDYVNWNTAYGWGDHSTAGYASQVDLVSTATALSDHEALTTSAHGGIASSAQLSSTAAALSALTYETAQSTAAIITSTGTLVKKSGDTMTGPLVIQKNAYPLLTLDNAAGGYYSYLDGAAWNTYGPVALSLNTNAPYNDVTVGRRLNVSSAVASVGYYGPGIGLTNIPANAIDGSTYTYRIDGLAAALSTAAYLPNSNVFTGTNNTFASITASSLSVTGDAYLASKLAINMTPDGSHALDVGGAIHASEQAIIGGTMTVQGNAFSVGGSTLVVNAGLIGIGVSPSKSLDILLGSDLSVRVADSVANSTNKNAKYVLRHYSTSEEDVMGLLMNSANGSNTISIGGGSSFQNAATKLSFYTAANATTVSGTERITVNSSGNVGIGTTGPASKLHMSSGVYINDGNSYGMFVGTTTTTNAAMRIVSRSGDEYVAKFSSSTGDASFGIHPNGHLSFYGSTVTLATCANAAVSTTAKRDSRFRIEFSGANSSCGINFGEKFDAEPVCTCTTFNTGNNGCEGVQVSASSVTFRPMSGAWAAGDKMNVHCDGAH